ncbi:hypothetical protein [Hyphomonas johnsonii]|uniref:Uncharacterized protein n=1 Tax=Hyphomonas johnsonii MHS-2 TaxID=1280950 RepID=A0A059FQC7_9PROT|nr:hypothetical protein [Hyphomonas johnsonii]KCZ92721.1 hypothetical protein HJO_07197 [Hyphomonas johnsonii MHS-2]
MVAKSRDDAALAAIGAQADLHHQYLLGLELMVATREGPAVVGDWMFRLFRRQHEAKFLSSFRKLGLDALPHAVACARYHVLSNGMGGVAVEYMEESDTKAWVRFRYPRWMYDGPAICGVPVEASRGFLRGWYAQNGVSLGNPRLGFVCVSEDMTGQFGLCGYFREYDDALAEDERLQFRPDERPPAYDPTQQPRPPEGTWDEARLAKANRNYAMDYIRNGLSELVGVLGEARTLELGKLAARLTGLQQFRHMAAALGVEEGGPEAAAGFLAAMMAGMGDDVSVAVQDGGGTSVHQTGLRIVRGMDGTERDVVLACWCDLWRGAIQASRDFMSVDVAQVPDGLDWVIRREA